MKKLFPFMIIISLLLSSCGGKEVQQDKMTVYTSFYAMYDFAKTIGEDDVVIENVVPTGSDVHDFELSASDMAKISNADLFIYNGRGMEHWAEDIADVLPEAVSVVCTSDVLTDNKETDPHVWLSFDNAKAQLGAICTALSEKDSENASSYKARLDEYTSKIDALKAEYENSDLSGKKIFVTHGAYGYLCSDFGMEQISVEGISGESDPSPAQMARVVDRIKAEGARCIFYDPLEGDKIAQAVAQETGIEAVSLYTFEGDGENRDYLTVMTLNLEQLKKSL